MEIKLTKDLKKNNSIVLIYNKDEKIENIYDFSEIEIDYINKKIQDKKQFVNINRLTHQIFILIIDKKEAKYKNQEFCRKKSYNIIEIQKDNNSKKLIIKNNTFEKTFVISLLEGLLLSNYSFDKYFTKEKTQFQLNEIEIIDDVLSDSEIKEIQNLCEGVNIAKDFVNEPFSYLTTKTLSKEIKKLSEKDKFLCDIIDKKQISSLKMGGLLAVNKGSSEPPAFAVLEWKPEKSKNKNPIILVGKGIVYDTGGLSLKPTTNSMDTMKSDMGGAASVVGFFHAISKNELPLHIIGLIPITDNACTNNSYAPGDVIFMHNGISVEVLNTDAEGRLILADALSYAQKYNPEIVIDLATLTGAAHRAIGEQGIIAMGNVSEKIFINLKNSGLETYERIVELPLWDEYEEMIKSSIADIKNIGGSEAGAITAGKFLEKFVNYPWIHLDIAPTAFIPNNKDYRGDGATGVGIRLLYNFFKNY